MNASPKKFTASASSPPQHPASERSNASIRVWDRFVRLAHWGLVALVTALILTAHLGQQENHMALGWLAVGVVSARVVWGFIGSTPARFASFAQSPFAALDYLREIAAGHPRRYLGHNPAGSLMVLGLLALVSILCGTGLVLQAALEFEGPLVPLLGKLTDHQIHELLVAHELAIYALYLAVPLHILGVILASRQHHESLVGAMIHGRKPQWPAAADMQHFGPQGYDQVDTASPHSRPGTVVSPIPRR